MNKKYIDIVFAAAFFIGLTLHLLIVLMIYYPGNFISMPLTGGMFLAWLFTSSTIKNLHGAEPPKMSLKDIVQKLPRILRYTLLFFSFYAAINFIITLSVNASQGWVDLDLSHDKLRGISGFWMLFYGLGYAAAYIEKRNRQIS